MNQRRTYRRGGCLVTGLVTVVVLIVVAALVVKFYVMPRVSGWIADGTRLILVEAVKEMHLPVNQESAIIKDIDRVTEDYKAGRITLDQLSNIFDELAQTPLLHMGVVHMIETHHIARSGLSEEKKQEAALAVQRFARGMYEKKLPENAVDQIQAPVFTTDQDGDRVFKDTLTDEELTALAEELKAKADEAGVANEPFKIDFATEFHKAIERALSNAGAADGVGDPAPIQPPAQPPAPEEASPAA